MKRRLSALAAILALAVGNAVMAAPLDDMVPKDAVVYAGWAGADSLQTQYDQSNLKAIIEASAIKQFIANQLPKLIDKANQQDPNAGEEIGKLQKGLAIAWHHPTAFYFCPLTFKENGPPAARFGLLCDAGTDAKALSDLLNDAIAKVPQDKDLPVHVAEEGSVVLLTFGAQDTLSSLKAGGALKGNAAFTSTMAQAKQNSPAVALFVDVPQILTQIRAGMATGAPPDAQQKFKALMDALGVNGVGPLAYQGGFDKKGWSEEAFASITGPRTGVLALTDNGPLSDNALAVVPKDAAAFSASKLDLHKIYTEALSIVGKVDDRAANEIDQHIAEVNQALGVNIERDILAPLGDEWVYYRAPGSDGSLSMALVSHLKDGPAFARTLDTFEKMFNEKSGSPFKVEKVTVGKQEVSMVAVFMYSIAWTVKDGYFYVSSLNGIGNAMAQVDTKAPSIATSELYQAVMAGMPKGVKFNSIHYSHPARIYPELRTMALGLIPMARSAGVDLPMNLLPDPTSVSEFMGPGGNVSWSDDAGFHFVGHIAFPGAEILGQQSSPTSSKVVALGAALLQNNLVPARTPAKTAGR
jgi:hypothetical protein